MPQLEQFVGLRKQCFADFLSQLVDRSQRHFDLEEVFQQFLCLPVALAVLSAVLPNRRRLPRPVTGRGNRGGQTGACLFTAVRTSQPAQPIFIYKRRRLWQFDSLMSQRIGTVTGQSCSTIAALCRTVIANTWEPLRERVELFLQRKKGRQGETC